MDSGVDESEVCLLTIRCISVGVIQVKMEDMLRQGLTPVYGFADRSVAIGVRPEHYEVIATVLPIALEVRHRKKNGLSA